MSKAFIVWLFGLYDKLLRKREVKNELPTIRDVCVSDQCTCHRCMPNLNPPQLCSSKEFFDQENGCGCED